MKKFKIDLEQIAYEFEYSILVRSQVTVNHHFFRKYVYGSSCATETEHPDRHTWTESNPASALFFHF